MSSNQNHSHHSILGNGNNEAEQRLWVKEQEINALKVQNRHLISKLEESESRSHSNIQPVVAEIEKSLGTAYEMLQGTMRGIYQQSQRCQAAVDELTSHSRDLENRLNEQRKADRVYFQDKIFASITAFCDRMERQIENRLQALEVIEVVHVKQNEILSDLDQIKNIFRSAEFKQLRGEIRSILKTGASDASKEDLIGILDRLRTEKEKEKEIAHRSERYLKDQGQNEEEAVTDEVTVIHAEEDSHGGAGNDQGDPEVSST